MQRPRMAAVHLRLSLDSPHVFKNSWFICFPLMSCSKIIRKKICGWEGVKNGTLGGARKPQKPWFIKFAFSLFGCFSPPIHPFLFFQQTFLNHPPRLLASPIHLLSPFSARLSLFLLFFFFFFFSSFSSLLLPINFSPPAPFANTMTTRKLLWAGTRKRTGQDKGLGIKQERRTPFCGKLLRKQTCLFQLILS